MLIDWVTVIAQIVNFLILIFLLKKFLYAPIRRAMQGREERVRAQVAEAEQARKSAEEKQAELDTRHQELRMEEERLRSKAVQETEEWKQAKFAELRAQYEQEKEKWSRLLSEEKERDSIAIRDILFQQAFKLARKLVAELSDERLEQQVLEKFLAELEGQAVREEFEQRSEPYSLRVTHGQFLDDETSEQLISRVRQLFPGAEEVSLTRDEEIVLGFVLEAGETQWQWNGLDGLRTMEAQAFVELGAVGQRKGH